MHVLEKVGKCVCVCVCVCALELEYVCLCLGECMCMFGGVSWNVCVCVCANDLGCVRVRWNALYVSAVERVCVHVHTHA